MNAEQRKYAVKTGYDYLMSKLPGDVDLWAFLTNNYPAATSDEKLSVFAEVWNMIN